MGSERKTSSRIDDAAAAWAARVDRGHLTAAEQASFEAWQANDRRCLGAYARAQAVLASMDRAQALGKDYAFSHPQARTAGSAATALRPRRSWRAAVALAAGVVSLALWWPPSWFAEPPVTTVKGELRQMPLPDGSSVTLNTATAIQTRFDARLRTVELVRGEALFDVAKDPQRPFQVQAGELTIKAIGTSFTVRRMPGQAVQVAVREGVVDILHPSAARPLRAVHNQVVTLSAESGAARRVLVKRSVTALQVERTLLWREGLVAFEGSTLAQAAMEFERYSDVRVIVVEPELAGQSITGLFAVNNPAGFARAAASAVGARVTEHGNELRISRP
jgi:transmembrane sensor